MKCQGIIEWSWFGVFSPIIFLGCMWLLFAVMMVVLALWMYNDDSL